MPKQQIWWAIAYCLVLVGCDSSPQTSRLVGQLAWDRVELTAEAAEPILAIPVHEGQSVTAGTVVIQLDDTRASASLAQATAGRKRAQAILAEMRRGTRKEQVAAAVATRGGAAAALTQANKDLRRQNELAQRQLISLDALDKATAVQAQSQANLDAAEARLAELRKGATAEERVQTGQALAQTIAAEQEAQVAVRRLRITAPQPGRIDTLPFKVGERPAQGAVVAVLLVGAVPYARVYVPEPLRTHLYIGDKVQVLVDGRASPFQGRVRKISSDPLFTPYFALTEHDRHYLSYIAEIDLDAGTTLPAGVPVEVTFNAAPEHAADER